MRINSIIKHLNRIIKYRLELAIPTNSVEKLVERHFKSWSDMNHVNFQLFNLLGRELGGKPAFIVETGTSAWGTDSTRFWNSYVSKYGGRVISVDIRPNAGVQLKYQLNKRTQLVTCDSVQYLRENQHKNVSLYYFDSADVDWSLPDFAIKHGLEETLAVIENLKSGTIVVFDDTPKNQEFVEEHLRETVKKFHESKGFFPGKGPLAIKALQEKYKIEVLHHEYSFACKILSRI